MSEIEQFFLENKFENNSVILKRDLTTNEFQNETENNQVLLFKSLNYAGYYLNTIDLIEKYLEENSCNNLFKKDLLFIQCEACLFSYDFERGKKVLFKLQMLLNELKIPIITNLYLFQLEIFKTFFNYNKNELITAEESITNFLEVLKSEEDQLVLAEYYKKIGMFYRRRHDFSKMINSFEIALNYYSIFGNVFEMAEIYYQLGYSYIIMGEIELATQNFEQSANLYEKLENSNKYAGSLCFLGYAFYKNVDLKKAEKFILQALEAPKVYDNDYFELYSKNNLGDIYFSKGELKLCLQQFLEAEQGFKMFGNKKLLGEVLNEIGRLYSAQGKFELSFSYHFRAKEIFNTTSDPLGIPWTQIYIGESLFEMGDFDNSINSWVTSYEQFKEINDKHGTGFSAVLLGKAHLVLNDNLALNYFSEAKEIFEDITNLQGLVESYIGEGIIFEERNEFEKADFILDKAKKIINEQKGFQLGIGESLYKYGLLSIEHSLGKIGPEGSPKYLDLILSYLNNSPDYPKSKQRMNFIKAIKLRTTQRLKEQYESMQLLESIVNSDTIIDYQTTLLSYLYIFETKIFELKIFNKLEIIEEANRILDDMIKLTSFSLSSWTAKILSLQARMKVLELQFDDAKKCLNDALQIAVSKNMNRIAFQFSNQYDNMVNTIVELEKKQASNLTLTERLELMDLSVFDLNRNKFNMQIPIEEPVYLSLITSQGVTLFSVQFGLFTTENFDQLISGFLVAINSVILKLFSSSGFIERIKHKEYTITLFTLIDPIHICYAYKGYSYHAQLKIEAFRDLLVKDHVVQLLLEASSKNKTLDELETTIVKEIVHIIFNN